MKAGLKEKRQPTSVKLEEPDQGSVESELLGRGEDGISMVPREIV